MKPNRVVVVLYACLTVLLLWAAGLTSAIAAGRPLPSDSVYLRGRLTNGVTWLYRQHNNPPGKMALQLYVRTGSLNETDAQQGLAHFLEHMAFNGTEHFPPGKLVPYFESIGMQFGPHLNAYTTFDHTVYMLYTPNPETNQVDKALMVLSDYAFRMDLAGTELDKERGIILEESRTGKGAQQRIRDQLWPELFAGSRFANRLPIGKDEIVAKAPHAEFTGYYRTWYRPENMTVMLVGDAPPAGMIPLIEKWFGTYQADRPEQKPAGPEFKPFTTARALVVTDPEMAYCQVQMMTLRPGRPPTVTVEQARVELVDYLGTWIIDRRFDDRVKRGEASYRFAGAGVSDFFNDAVMVSANASGEPADWAKMQTEVITEIKRAREYGFTEREIQLARTEILAAAERAARTESTRNARDFLSEIVDSVNDRTPLMSAQQQLDLYSELLPGISLREVNQAFRDWFAPGSFAQVVIMGRKEGTAVPAREELLAKARAAWELPVEAPKEEAAITSLLSELPPPGKVVETSVDADLQVTSGWLENGVRFHHRFMDYKKDTVFVSIALAGGTIEETASNAGVTDVASLVVEEPATSRISSSRMRDFMTGKNISVSGGASGDSFMMTVTGSPKDLEAGLQQAYALLTDGKLEEPAFRNYKLRILRSIEQREKLPTFKATEALEHLLSSSDPRRVPVTRDRVEAQTIERAQEWFNRLSREAPIEVALVGELPLEQARPLIERYLGSLAKRPREAAHLKPFRKSPRPAGPLAKSVQVETVTPQAVVLTGFAGTEGRNTVDARALELARNILSSRLVKRIREELSLVYSISAQNVTAWIYEDAGRFGTGAPCDPANAQRVVDEVQKMFREFGEKGPTAEELENAKKQVANLLDTNLREPSYWWGVLRNYGLHGRRLDVEKQIRDDYQALTPDQVRAVFAKYCTPARTYSVIATPVPPKTGP